MIAVTCVKNANSFLQLPDGILHLRRFWQSMFFTQRCVEVTDLHDLLHQASDGMYTTCTGGR